MDSSLVIFLAIQCKENLYDRLQRRRCPLKSTEGPNRNFFFLFGAYLFSSLPDAFSCRVNVEVDWISSIKKRLLSRYTVIPHSVNLRVKFPCFARDFKTLNRARAARCISRNLLKLTKFQYMICIYLYLLDIIVDFFFIRCI